MSEVQSDGIDHGGPHVGEFAGGYFCSIGQEVLTVVVYHDDLYLFGIVGLHPLDTPSFYDHYDFSFHCSVFGELAVPGLLWSSWFIGVDQLLVF